jgi:hypothetical protein
MLDIQGQPRALAHLQRAIHSGRLASTWIFAGPPGVGKFKTAVAMAKTCLCDQPIRRPNREAGDGHLATLPDDFVLTQPCGTCESCVAVEHGTHPDLHLVSRQLIRYHDKSGKSKGTTLSIQVIRGEITGDDSEDHRVEAKLYKRSQRNRGKWFIIDEADLMELPAQNSLLKALEEPPPGSYLIMITASPGELLSTIRSRSQIVLFAALPAVVVATALQQRGATTEQAQLLARLSGGSLGRALGWFDQEPSVTPARATKVSTVAKTQAEKVSTDVFTWVRHLTAVLDNLATGRGGSVELAATIHRQAEEYAQRSMQRDPLASKDQATRDGVAVMLGFVATWFDDRLRNRVGAEVAVPVPSSVHAMPESIVVECLRIGRGAEVQLDANAHVGLLLAATTTAWEQAMTGSV